eukprot:c11015_g2_i1 orf=51-410(+)
MELPRDALQAATPGSASYWDTANTPVPFADEPFKGLFLLSVMATLLSSTLGLWQHSCHHHLLGSIKTCPLVSTPDKFNLYDLSTWLMLILQSGLECLVQHFQCASCCKISRSGDLSPCL